MVQPLRKTRPNPQYRAKTRQSQNPAKTGRCHISANTQSCAVVKAPRVIVLSINLSNGCLIVAVVAIFSNPVANWSQTYSS